MPNEVDCTLVITGAPDEVRKCLASIASPASESEDARLFDFNRVIPLHRAPAGAAKLPDHTPIERAPSLWTGAMGRAVEDFAAHELGVSVVRDRTSDERVALWGTKWNAHAITVERQPEGGGARIRFYTAWAPPVPVIEALAGRFPNLGFDLTYFDQQAPVAGRLRRAPGGGGWATIDARYDYGFCRAAYEAVSWDPWQSDSADGQPGARPDGGAVAHPAS